MIQGETADSTLILDAGDVYEVLDMASCIEAVEQGFKLTSTSIETKVLGFHAKAGSFHMKAALLQESGKRGYFAAKMNANFPTNAEVNSLPTIQGVLTLFDAVNGRVLALIDSIAITLMRTAAASAVAGRALARKDSSSITIVGCGAQADSHLAAFLSVFPLKSVVAIDRDSAKAEDFAWRNASPGLEIVAAEWNSDSELASDIVVTCTPSKSAFLRKENLRTGTFVAAVGADNPEKSEIDPVVMAESVVITDSTDQCVSMGDLHHAIAAGVMKRENVRAELSEVLRGEKPGRTSDRETIIYDSTGVAFQDVVCAAFVYERATARELGISVRLGAVS